MVSAKKGVSVGLGPKRMTGLKRVLAVRPVVEGTTTGGL
jgi:hypothetical protein